MKRIHIYEAEPGDYRFNDADDYEDYVEVDDGMYDYLKMLKEMRDKLNHSLEELKKREIDPWDEETPTK